jgi:molybdate transport system permease protein
MLDIEPFILTFKLAVITTVVLFLVGIPLSFWLAYSSNRFKMIVEAIVSLPLILPPSVLGFYLLLAFSPANAFGNFLEKYLDIRLVFTFAGLAIASVIYSLPFMIQPLLSGFRTLPQSYLETSYTLGKGRMETLWKVLLPNIKSSLLTAGILSFAHTIGEFGVVLMVGGNIPGVTRVVSVAVYDEVEAMNYPAANQYSIILVSLAFILLMILHFVNYRSNKAYL